MRTIRLLIEYDGTAYAGWQAQKNGPSIQEALETAIFKVTGERLRIAGSGRTDAGVHALGQVASFKTGSGIAAQKLACAITAHLPDDVTVLSAEEVPEGFHPRKGAKRKTYRYRILNRLARPAIERGKVYHVVPRLDAEAMRRAARHFEGRHDFRAFTTASCAASKKGGCERHVFSAEVVRREDEITVEITGSGFLHNMVRRMVGTLVEVGRGRILPAEVGAMLAAHGSKRSGPTAPACGLYLARAEY